MRSTLLRLAVVNDWSLIGEKTFTPDDFNEVIGSFSLAVGDDTLWIRVTQLNPDPNSPWSYGILGWRSSQGYELGSTKAYGQTESEIFRLGVGRSPSDRTGSITFEPRAFNLGWIKEGWPWSLRFEAASGTTAGGGQTIGAVANSFVDNSDNGLSLVRVDFG